MRILFGNDDGREIMMKPITPFTGIPNLRPAAKPSHQAVMRRIGVHDGLSWLLTGYAEAVRGPKLFPAKGVTRYVE